MTCAMMTADEERHLVRCVSSPLDNSALVFAIFRPTCWLLHRYASKGRDDIVLYKRIYTSSNIWFMLRVLHWPQSYGFRMAKFFWATLFYNRINCSNKNRKRIFNLCLFLEVRSFICKCMHIADIRRSEAIAAWVFHLLFSIFRLTGLCYCAHILCGTCAYSIANKLFGRFHTWSYAQY